MSDKKVFLDSKVPDGPLEKKWENHKFLLKQVNPANKRKFSVIVVGTGLAGASASSSLAELGYKVTTFCIHDSPRRAHSIAAQGGINAAKNYQNDGDSVWRLFYDTIKGGDYRSREANVYRLAEVANDIIDQGVAQGIPFARDYGGYLANRSFGGAQVSRTFYARGQTGQQLLLGAYSSLMKEVKSKKIKLITRTEMVELVLVDGKARGIITRDLETGKFEKHMADAVVLATGGYGNVFFLSTNAKTLNGSAIYRAYKKGAVFANPCFVQIHPTCLPVHGEGQSKLTLMSESLRNDGRVWVPKKAGDNRPPNDIPEDERDYYLERIYPSFGNLVPRDVASRNAKNVVDEGRGVGKSGVAVYLDFEDAKARDGVDSIITKYGNLFEMYERITDEDPYKVPMRIYPAIHYTMGGLWVDYNLMSNIEGLYVLGEANFSDHGANRLGASALMQGLADGYFVLPYTINDYLASNKFDPKDIDRKEFDDALNSSQSFYKKLKDIKGTKSPDYFHKKLGKIMWEYVGMGRDAEGLSKAIEEIPKLKEEFWKDVKVVGDVNNINEELEKAGRVADFLDIGELMARDALERVESCGGHFRLESKTDEGEAKRDDENFTHVAAWEYKGENETPIRHVEELNFEFVKLTQRSYK